MPHRGKKVRRRKVVKSKIQPSFASKVKSRENNVPLNELSPATESEDFIPLSTSSKKVRKKVKNEPLHEQAEEIEAMKPRSKSGRVIIRNLPFKVTEESLREHLKSYGPVEEVNLLYKPDGKLVGCGFVQFSNKANAAKAIEECNAKPFLGRIIILDWAVPKEVFKKKYRPPEQNSNQIAIKSEEEEADQCESAGLIKSEDEAGDETDEKNLEDDPDQSDSEELHGEDSEEELDESPQSRGSRKSQSEEEEPSKRAPPNVLDRDCTVFLKNVSFQTTSEELKEFMEKFGPVAYALICVDRVTDHSKGTAFVKFKNGEGAKSCLAAESDELTLDCSKIVAVPAVSREEARQRIDEQKKKTPKDGRNLYLMKEGVITAGSKAANGVSVSDMTKRVKQDDLKTNMLKNLNMFVSRYRLAIHNLPMEFTDRQLRRLFQKHSDREAIIKEARVMRNLKVVDANGIGQSKGYGFVSFTKHEHALQALRNINNNPDIFSPDQRPIVAFSIENRAILNAKHKRLLKSQQMNPLYQGNVKKPSSGKAGGRKGGRKNFQGAAAEEQSDDMVPKYGGLTGKPGVSSLRSKKKLQGQLKTHVENVKKSKQKKKALLQQPKLRKVSDARTQPSLEKKLKRKLGAGDEAFTQLVKKYKQQLTSNVQKWYE